MFKKLGYLLLISLVINLQQASCDPVSDNLKNINSRHYGGYYNTYYDFYNNRNPVYKLQYFDIRARGELLRWIFKAANRPFEDVRIKDEDWPAIKPTTPFGQLPVLDIIPSYGSIIRLSQSGAIARFLAKRFGLLGRNDIETAIAEMYGDQINDVFNKIIDLSQDDPSFNQTIINNFKLFEDRLTKNNGFFSGCQLTYPDIYLSSLTDNFNGIKGDLLKQFPKITELDNKIRNIPGIKDWIAKRPAE